MTKRNFHFFRLEDRVLLSGEGLDPTLEMIPDGDAMADLQSDVDALQTDLDAIEAAVLAAAGEALPNDTDDGPSDVEISDIIDPATGIDSLDPARPIEVIFIDAGVEDSESLIAGLRDNGENGTQWVLVHLESDSNGIEQITSTLSSLSSVDAIHLLSHGDGEGVQLGNVKLDQETSLEHAGDIASWGHALDNDADLLIYGCDLASTTEGQDLIEMLALVCNCDVAASDDATGHADLGGDWILEYSVGDVTTEVAFGFAAQASWFDTLATITVTTTDDENDGNTSNITALEGSPGGTGISLREAIRAANNTAGADTIVLGAGTYVLDITGQFENASVTGDLDVTSQITITGDRLDTTILDASSLGDRIFYITNAGVLTISDMTLTGASSGTEEGAAVYNEGNFSATDVAFTNNTVGNVGGGAIYSRGTTTLDRTSLIGNTSGASGGAIHVYNGTTTITNSTISGNTTEYYGGGLYAENAGSTVNIVHSTIADNTVLNTNGYGGGVYVTAATVNTEASIFADNTSNLGGSDINGTIVSGGYNIIEHNSGFSGTVGTDIVGSDPSLAALSIDATSGQSVHVIDNSSIAYNAATSSSTVEDQRGVTRDGSPDIGAYEQEAPPELLAHYQFNSGSGATDSSGNGLDGVLQGDASVDTTSGTNQVGDGKLTLDGTGDYVDLSANIGSFSGLSSGTVAAWVKLSTSGFSTIFDMSDGATSNFASLWVENGNLIWAVSSGGTALMRATSTATINDDTWHHVAVTTNGSGTKLYIDGVHLTGGDVTYSQGDATTTTFLDDLAGASSVKLGAYDTGSVGGEFTGLIDDARVYTSALNDSDMTALYAYRSETPTDLTITETNDGGLSINEDGGNDAYLIAEDGLGIPTNLTKITYEVQFSATQTTSLTPLISYATGADSNEFMVSFQDNGNLHVFIGDHLTSSAIDYRTITDGTQHSLALTWDSSGGDWKIFVDGLLVDSGTGFATGNTIDSGGTLVFGHEQDSLDGGYSSGQLFSGKLFDARVFDDVRTESEIAQSYRSELPHDEANLIANWRFDDLSSNGIATESVSGNNLTVKHVAGGGFTNSNPTLTLSVNENAAQGTVIGFIDGSDLERTAKISSLLAADADLRYSAETGKFHKLISTTDTWVNAQSSAIAMTLGGVSGQLLTIDSAAENELATSYAITAGGHIWLGYSDQVVEGEFREYTGTSAGRVIWRGTASGTAVDGVYTNWQAGEPNDSGGSQDFGKLYTTGTWDDEGSGSTFRSVVEWDADAVLDNDNALTYSIQSQTVPGAFAINASTGTITVADGSLLDYETNATHSLTVRVSDVDSNTYDEVFTISLNDLVESNNAPTDLSSGIELNADGGNDAYLVADDGGAVLAGLSQLTYETTFQAETNTDTILVSYASTSTQHNDFLIELNGDGTASMLINGSAVIASSIDYNSLMDGETHHLAFSWDNTNGNWALYVDGDLTDSGSGLATGQTLRGTAGTSELVFGQEQDDLLDDFDSSQIFSGTIYDVRIWNEVRSQTEISLNYQNKISGGSIPSGLIANWQMDGFNGFGEVVDIVSGNNLSVGHATGPGFIASTPVEDLHIAENSADGTTVGYAMPSDPDVSNDIVSDGLFTEASPSTSQYGVSGTFGDWTVSRATVDLFSISDWQSPLGGRVVNLDGSAPGTIEQTLTTVAGQQYQVVFSLSGDFSGGEAVKNLRVSASGTSANFEATQTSNWSWGETGAFEQRSFTFTADGNTSLLQFHSLEGASSTYGPYIADIQVIEIPAAVTAILDNDASLSYDAGTGKFYRAVNSSITWSAAQTAALNAGLNGIQGELVTIESQYENDLIVTLSQGLSDDAWLGASDQDTEGTWKWYDGTNANETFWIGDAGGTAQTGHYTNWSTIEPNDSFGEDFAEIRKATGEWNDLNGGGTNAYIIQWNAGEVLSNFTFSLTDDAGGRFAINESTGEITVANGTLLNYEAANSHSVVVQTTDATGNSYNESMSIAVDDANDAPVMSPYAPTYNTTEDAAAFSANVSALLGSSVSDADTGAVEGIAVYGQTGSTGTLEFSINGGSSWQTFSSLSETNATLLRATDLFRFTPDGVSGGTMTLDYYAWDQTDGTAGSGADVSSRGGTTAYSTTDDTVTINVSDINDEQTVSTNDGATFDEGSSGNTITSAMLETTDIDNTTSELTYSVTGSPSHGQLMVDGISATTFTQADINAGRVTYNHDDSENFSDSFSFSVDDGAGAASTGSFSITLNPINDNAVAITSDGGGATASLNVNETVSFVTQVTVSDADMPGDTMTYSIIGGTDQADFTIDSSGNLTFVSPPDYETPDDSDSDNVYEVTVQVSDGVHTDSQTITVTVLDVQSTALNVTTTSDVDDTGLGATYTIEELYAVGGGTDGEISLREAIIAANNTLGQDTINFEILNSDAGYSGTAGTDAYWQISLTAALPTITESVILDGTSQTTFGGNVNPGTLGVVNEAGTNAQAISDVERPEIAIVGASGFSGIVIGGDNVTVQGFSMYGFSSGAAIYINDAVQNTFIDSNELGVPPTGITDPGAALNNQIHVQSVGADNGTLSNNILAYSKSTGLYASNGSDGWSITGNQFIDSGYNYSNGDAIAMNGSIGGSIDGNYFTGSSTQAIILSGSSSGITISDNTIVGNGVGPVTGSHVQYDAIALRNGTNNITLTHNIIAENYGAGILVNDGAFGIEITENSIYGNGNVLSRQGATASGIAGIDLQGTGENASLGTAPYYTANDAGDADTGGNSLQNFPVITQAISNGSQITLLGNFNSVANETFTIEFFTSASYANGYGQGQTFVGSISVTTDGSGNAAFNYVRSGSFDASEFVTATATNDSTKETSEFAAQVAINGPVYANQDDGHLEFDGTDDYVAITSSPELTMSNTMTMEAWVRPDASANTDRMILNKEGEYEMSVDADGSIKWAFANSDPGWAWHDTNYTLTDGEWAHVAVSYNNGTVSTYVNGELVEVYEGSGTIGDSHPTLNELHIGGRGNNPTGQYFQGGIDDVRVWNVVRSQAEIRDGIDTPPTGSETGLVGYYQFNGSGTTVVDASGDGNHGTLGGGVSDQEPTRFSYIVNEDSTLSVLVANGLLVNDVDTDDDPLTITEINGNNADIGNNITLPSGATIQLEADGSFSYIPGPNYQYLTDGETATETFSYTVSDGNGNTDTTSVTITIVGVNDAPVLDDNYSTAFDAITEDDVDNSGQSVASILASSGQDILTDADNDPEGIAIVASNPGNGVWEYSTNGGSNWTGIGSVSDANALLLQSTDLVRFNPNGELGTTASINFRGWDETSGTAGSFHNITATGGDSAFSSNTESATIVVGDRNDAPVLDNTGDVTLTAEAEDSGAPVGAVGTVITDIVSLGGNVTDVDTGSQIGIAVTAADTTNGTWWYTIDSGSTWNALGSVSDSSARVLNANSSTRVYFEANANYTGTVTDAITFRAWDRTLGPNGSLQDASTNGGITAFSSATESADITINSVNDAPVLDDSFLYTLSAINEDETTNGGQTVASILSSNAGTGITDVDTSAVEGIAIRAISSSSGYWEYSLNGGTDWSDMGTLSTSSSLVLRDTDLVRFIPDETNGEQSNLTFVAWDQTDGSTAGTKVNSLSTGGTTAFSSEVAVARITVTDVNDAPTLTDSATINLGETNEDTDSVASSVASILASAGSSDVDSSPLSGLAVTSTTGNGTWQYSTDGTNWTDFGTVSTNNALLLTSTSEVRYSPDGIDGETATFGFLGWDQTVSSGSSFGSPSLADPTGKTGGTNEFSDQTATASILVTSINDAVIAVADTGSATEAGGIANATAGSDATGNVLSNDNEIDPGDILNVTGVATGTVASADTNVAASVTGIYGSITIAANGNYTYVVDENNAIVQSLRTSADTITDTFTYTVTDSGGATSSTQIVVTIHGQNDAPVALTDNATAVEGGGLNNADAGTNPTGNVLTNDTDVDAGDTKTVTGSVVGAATGALGASVAGTYGSITINADGSYSYIVDNSNAAVEALRTSSDTLDDVFTYTITDTDGATSSTQITVTIEGQNDDPNAIDDNLTAVESGGVSNATAGSDGTGNVLSNDTDKDAADTKTVIGVVSGSQSVASGNVGTGVAGAYGTLTIDATGNATFVVDENNAAVQSLRTVGDTLSEVFTYTIIDTAGADATAEVTVTITGQNDAPVAVANAATAIEASGMNNNVSGTDPSGNVLTNDTDLDGGDTKTVVGVDTGIQATTSGSVGVTVMGTYGEIVINSDGSYTYTLDNDNAAVDALLVGESLSETFSYTMQDTAGLQSTTQIAITIDGRTDLPVAESDMATAVEAGGLNNASPGSDPSGNVLANDAANNGKVVVGVDAGITALATGDVGTEVVGTYGSVVIDANGDFTYTLDNDNLAVEALRTSGEHVTDVFTYSMEDNDSNSSTTQLTITVDGNNDVIIAVADIGTAVESGGLNNGTAGSNATGNLITNDIDVDSGDTKSVVGVQLGTQTSTSGSVGASVAGNYGHIVINNDGSYTYTIDESLSAVQALRTTSDTLTETYSYTVTDTAGTASTTQIVITIQGGNDTPTAVVDAATAYEAGGVTNATPGTDPTGNVLTNDTDVDSGDTKTVVGVAAGTTGSAAGNVNSPVVGIYGSITIAGDGSYAYAVDNDNSTVQALRTSGQFVTDTFTYTFEDTNGLSSTTQITVTVRGTNDAIAATADNMTATEAGGTANDTAGTNPTMNVLANDTDVDAGDTKAVSGVAAGNVGSASGSVGASVAGQYGNIQIASDGTATYTVDNSNTSVQALLNSSDTLTDVFTYTVQDTNGLESTTQVTVTIEGANDAPVAIVDAGIADESGGVSNATAGNNATGNVLTNDNPVDTGDTHSVTGLATGVQSSTTGGVGSGVVGTYGTMNIDSAGNYSYVIDETNTDVEALRTSSDTLSEVFSYTTEDAAGLSSTSQITITIRGANDNPVAIFDTAIAIEAGGVGNGAAGTNPTGNVLTNDTDVDSLDTKNVAGVVAGVAGSATGNVGSDVTGTYGSIHIDANGNYTYTTDNNNAAVEALRNSSETLDDVFTYTTIDAAGGTSTTQITVTIQGSNDEPIISVEAGDSAAESISETNTTLTTTGTLTVTDLDLTDSVTSTVSSVVASGTTTGLASDNAALLAMLTSTTNVLDSTEQSDKLNWNFNSASETFNYLAVGESLTLTYTITVTDIAGTTDTQNVVITINGTNDAPDVTIGGGSAAVTLT
ncbi:CSLREA domain-containing protein, partial [Rhodopirellula rubra]